MDVDKNYLSKILSNPRTSNKLIKRNRVPVRTLDLNLTPMSSSMYEKNLSDFGSKKFKDVYNRISNFPSNWIEFSSGHFITPQILKDRDVSSVDWGFSRKQSNLILDLAENVKNVRLDVNYGEFFNSVKDFAQDKFYGGFNSFLEGSDPLNIGVVRKDYCGNELRLESIFNNIRYSKNA